MTLVGADSLVSHLVVKGRLLAPVILVVFTTFGCLASSLAPLALQAGEMAGAGLMKTAEPKSSNDESLDSSEKEERCDELEVQVPDTIEFHLADQDPGAWRRLQLGRSSDSPQWEALASEQNAAGWRPLASLQNMSFAPPLQEVLKPGRRNYLAYAPAEPRTSIERDQLVALTADFGAGMGTFQWNGRTYQYTLVNRLPCFPGPVVVARESRG